MNIVEMGGTVTFTVRVVPRASKSEIIGEHDGALKVRIASPPVDGAANTELIKLLAKQLGVSKSNVEIIGGQTSKTKQIRITGITTAQIASVLKAKT
ncbi:MAG: YggU family protein [Pyrinomonadaceae bacterium]|nr:YggU family protein [Acidobacteriota bacterium]MBK7932940.1 YggU family protein [Acidobacteriota bacterium]MBP7376599.1 YggU family protein [Pyrinomonadaceae bacterium]